MASTCRTGIAPSHDRRQAPACCTATAPICCRTPTGRSSRAIRSRPASTIRASDRSTPGSRSRAASPMSPSPTRRRSTPSSCAPGSRASSRRWSRRTRWPSSSKLAPTLAASDNLLVMNMCGRGDKDIFAVAEHLEHGALSRRCQRRERSLQPLIGQGLQERCWRG